MGQPTKCTPELTAQVAEKIREFGSVELVCMLVGIHRDTHYAWLQRGEEGEQPYATYSDTIKKAQADFAAENLRQIREGGPQWQRFSWLNERILPDLFALRQKVEHSGKVEGAAPVLTPAELNARLAEIDDDRPH